MPNCTDHDASIPIENAYILSWLLPTLYAYMFPLLLHTVIAQCIFYVQGHCNHGCKQCYAHNYDNSFSRAQEISLIVKATLHEHVIHALTTTDTSLYT